MTARISRREIILRAIQIPAGGALLLGLGACSGGSSGNSQATACADPDAMSDSEKGLRTSMSYVEKSPDLQKVCGGCSFFHPGASGSACGTCDMFTGGPANSQGHCNSWSAKA